MIRMHVHLYGLLFFLYNSDKNKDQFHKFRHRYFSSIFSFSIVFPIFDSVFAEHHNIKFYKP